MAGAIGKRWALVRDNVRFQIKLMLDAGRDLLLSPVAILCTVLDLLFGNQPQQGYFQRLMSLGHKTDHWLNLFGDVVTKESLPKSSSSKQENNQTQQKNVDQLFGKVEALLDEQHQNGGLTKSAKQKIDQYLDSLIVSDSSRNQAAPLADADFTVGEEEIKTTSKTNK